MNNLFAVVGPTASGKTSLSIALAKKINGVIVSVDSMQIYRGMDIGTAKPTLAERQGVPHYMIDVADIHDVYSVQRYVAKARGIIDQMLSENIPVILCGGTGLYFDHLVQDTSFIPMASDPEYVESLHQYTGEQLWEMVAAIDPVSAKQMHPNNRKRMIRALEVYKVSGQPISYWASISHQKSDALSPTIIGLDFCNRKVLHDRINMRVDTMMQQGLLDEVISLKRNGLENCKTANAAIGYKEILDYLHGNCSLEQAVETIRTRSRQYAKRQLTWFRRNKNIHWFFVDEYENDLFQQVTEYCCKER